MICMKTSNLLILVTSQRWDGHPYLLMQSLLPALLHQPKSLNIYNSAPGKKGAFWISSFTSFINYVTASFRTKKKCSLLSLLISALLRESKVDSLPSSALQTNCYPHSHWRNRHHEESDGGRQDLFICDEVQAGNKASFHSNLQCLRTVTNFSFSNQVYTKWH